MKRMFALILAVVSISLICFSAVAESTGFLTQERFLGSLDNISEERRYITVNGWLEKYSDELGYTPKYTIFEDDRTISIHFLNEDFDLPILVDKELNKVVVLDFDIPKFIRNENEIVSMFPEEEYHLRDLENEEYKLYQIFERRNGTIEAEFISLREGEEYKKISFSFPSEWDYDDWVMDGATFRQLYYELNH